ncbi:MAG: hypothetical protein QOF88_3783 [Mycobacterium sp.]|nr:hypothetical protein [Mycobacterium sp.]MDT5288894.1 hypothetical protein [Mycobacterium sp.]
MAVWPTQVVPSKYRHCQRFWGVRFYDRAEVVKLVRGRGVKHITENSAVTAARPITTANSQYNHSGWRTPM